MQTYHMKAWSYTSIPHMSSWCAQGQFIDTKCQFENCIYFLFASQNSLAYHIEHNILYFWGCGWGSWAGVEEMVVKRHSVLWAKTYCAVTIC
jgi:hypothetical protein